MKRRICQPTLPARPFPHLFSVAFRVSEFLLPAGACSCTGHQRFSLPSFLPWMPFADPPRDTTAPTTSFDPSDAARTLMSRTKTLTIWVPDPRNMLPSMVGCTQRGHLSYDGRCSTLRTVCRFRVVDGSSNLVGSYRVFSPLATYLALSPYSIHRKQTKNATIETQCCGSGARIRVRLRLAGNKETKHKQVDVGYLR